MTISLHIVTIDNFTRDYKCTFNHVHYLIVTKGSTYSHDLLPDHD